MLLSRSISGSGWKIGCCSEEKKWKRNEIDAKAIEIFDLDSFTSQSYISFQTVMEDEFDQATTDFRSRGRACRLGSDAMEGVPS